MSNDDDTSRFTVVSSLALLLGLGAISRSNWSYTAPAIPGGGLPVSFTGDANQALLTPNGSAGLASLRRIVAADLQAITGAANLVLATPPGGPGPIDLRTPPPVSSVVAPGGTTPGPMLSLASAISGTQLFYLVGEFSQLSFKLRIYATKSGAYVLTENASFDNATSLWSKDNTGAASFRIMYTTVGLTMYSRIAGVGTWADNLWSNFTIINPAEQSNLAGDVNQVMATLPFTLSQNNGLIGDVVYSQLQFGNRYRKNITFTAPDIVNTTIVENVGFNAGTLSFDQSNTYGARAFCTTTAIGSVRISGTVQLRG